MNIWRLFTMFFMTVGIITMVGILLRKTGVSPMITELDFTYSSPVIAFIGAAIGLFLMKKERGSKIGFSGEEVFYIVIIGVLIISLYMMYPEYMPPSFNVLAWARTPVLP